MRIETRYAARSIRRNLRRTALSVLGIGIGCGLAVFVDGINRGKDELYVRAAVETGIGHLRVAPRGWLVRRDPDLRLPDPARLRAACETQPGVEVVTARARAQALLAMGNSVVPLEVLGVEPRREPRVDRLVRHVTEGRYLEPGESGSAVVGQAALTRLGAALGDDLLASAVGADGNIDAIMLRVVGVISTGSEDVDAGICHVPLADVERLTGRPGPGELTLLLHDWRRAERVRGALARRLGGVVEVVTWKQIAPDFEGHLRQDTAASHVITGLIVLIVLLGVASAQLAAVLERRREFAVLAALGMGAGRMVRLVLQEALLLGLAGAAVGLALGAPPVLYFARAGLRFQEWFGGNYEFGGLIVDPILYCDAGAWMVVEALLIALVATVLASLYPAWYASRTDPAAALRVAQ